MAKSFIDELDGYRVKVERDGKEVVNIPGILALPGALIAPKMSIIGTIAASLMGCSIHVENPNGKGVDVSKAVKDAADSVKTAAKTVKEEIDKAWDELSADDPEGCPVGKENEPEEEASDEKPAEKTAEEIVEDLEKHQAEDDIPVIHAEKPEKPE